MLLIFVSGPRGDAHVGPRYCGTTLDETGSVVASCTPWRDSGYLPGLWQDRPHPPLAVAFRRAGDGATTAGQRRDRKRCPYPLLMCGRAKRHKGGPDFFGSSVVPHQPRVPPARNRQQGYRWGPPHVALRSTTKGSYQCRSHPSRPPGTDLDVDAQAIERRRLDDGGGRREVGSMSEPVCEGPALGADQVRADVGLDQLRVHAAPEIARPFPHRR